jgi:uncharacterized protein (TIGR03435 family)
LVAVSQIPVYQQLRLNEWTCPSVETNSIVISHRLKSDAARCLVLALAISFPGFGQIATPKPAQEETLRFAVSSIKPSNPDAQMRDMRIMVSGPNLRAVNCTPDELLLSGLQIFWRSEGGPNWVRERRFDIVAKSEEGTSPSKLTPMTLQLLRDRFKLAWHIESREVRGWALTIGKKPDALLPAKDGERMGVTWGSSAVFRKMSMADFARSLAGPMDVPVVDRTGLKGEFDITLPLDEYRPPGADVTFADTLRNAVEGVGFRLVDEKVKRDQVIIDHAELPDAN